MFCSRELEAGLVKFVLDEGGMPSDEELRAHAKEILRCNQTAADDKLLLAKFKEFMREKMGTEEQEELPSGMEQMITDKEIGDILKDMDMDLGVGEVEEAEEGGVHLGL